MWYDEKQEKPKEQVYYGITTNVISMETLNFDADKGEAEFKLVTQRKETSGTPSETKTFNQSAVATFSQEAGTWKVEQFKWL